MIRVLVVDDELSLCEISRVFLSREGDIAVETAQSAQEALEILDKNLFDVIVSDYQMPGMDGIQFLEEVRKRKGKIPFILFTGRGREEVVIKALNAGADSYMQKGGDPQSQFVELTHKIRQVVQINIAEQALRENEIRYRTLFQQASDIIRILDRNNIIVFDSPSSEKILGYPHGSFIGKSPFDFIHPDDLQNVRSGLSEVHERKNTGNPVEFRIRKENGEYIWVESIAVNLIGVKGVDGIVVTTRPIHERKQADETLRKSEAQLNRAEKIGRSGNWEIRLDTGEVTASEGARLLYGLEVNRWTLEAVQKIPMPEYRPLLDKALRDLIAGKFPYDIEFAIRRPSDGTILDIQSLAKYDPVQNVVFGVIHDITARKLAEKALRESEEKFSTIIASMQIGVVIIDAATHTILEVNQKGLEMIGGPGGGICGSVCHRYICPAEQGKCPVSDLGQDVDFSERVLLNLRGEMIPIIKSVIKTTVGGKEVLIEAFFDITERKLADDLIRTTLQRLDTLISSLYAGVLMVSENDTVEHVNQAFCDLFRLAHSPEYLTGLASHEMITMLCEVFDTPSESIARIREITAQRKPVKGEELILSDGRIISVDYIPVIDSDGKRRGRIWHYQDITHRKQELAALASAHRKLRLLSGVTRHDINNQLSILQAYLDVLMEKEHDQSLDTYFRKATGAVERIAEMIRFTKEYEGIGVNAPAWQDCSTRVSAAAHQVPLGNVRVKNDLSRGTEVFADPLIGKVFFNLIDNAVRHGGKITTVRFFDAESDGDYIMVCEDDGEGVPADEKVHIFERGVGKHTGMGLFFTREILSITGITIRETGEPGNGARFEILVPKSACRSENQSDPA